MPGKQPRNIIEYMNHIAGYTLRVTGETVAEYKLRLYHLAVEKYRQDLGDTPEWYLLQNKPQPTIHEELAHPKQKRLLKVKYR